MSFADDLQAEVASIFRGAWDTREGRIVPEPADVVLGNEAVEFERATVLYADLSGSTKLVNSRVWWFAAEIYKSFLHSAARIIRSEGGVITSYDGDRVMAIWIGSNQTTAAARCALKINYAVKEIVNPTLMKQYKAETVVVRQVVGIDTGRIYATRTGVRGDNDLVWVGRAANYAAKLTELDLIERTWITGDAYEYLHEISRTGGSPLQDMWTKYFWTENEDMEIYGAYIRERPTARILAPLLG